MKNIPTHDTQTTNINFQKFPSNIPLISIIIPVYNVENFIKKTLDSIFSQTLSHNYYEVIIIDDASTDSSLNIIKTYTLHYSNVRIIELSQNTIGGAGIPSNIGINSAIGKYIVFIDSDDYVAPKMLELLLEKAVETNAEVVVCDFNVYNEREKKLYSSYDKKNFNILLNAYKNNETITNLKKKILHISPVPWRKLYKKSFLNLYNIRYPEGDFFYEDNPLHWFVTLNTNKVAIIDKVLITHRIGRIGQTVSADSEKLLDFSSHAEIIYSYILSKDNRRIFIYDYIYWSFKTSKWILNKLKYNQKKFLLTFFNPIKSLSIKELILYKKKFPHSKRKFVYYYCLLRGYLQCAKIIKSISKF